MQHDILRPGEEGSVLYIIAKAKLFDVCYLLIFTNLTTENFYEGPPHVY